MTSSILPASFVSFLEANGVDLSEYGDQLRADPPRFIRLSPVAVVDLHQLALDLGCPITSTILADFFAVPGHVKIAHCHAYRDGRIYGVDLASGLAVDNLSLDELPSGCDEEGRRGENAILDMCCAPGAKLAMICDRIGRRGVVVGLDVSEQRLRVVTNQIVDKYGLCRGSNNLDLTIECTDATLYSGRLFSRVLVDAECSHDGSIKHVLKYSKWGWDTFEERFMSGSRLEHLCSLQRRLLANGFRHLKPGGVLVYSTCSFCTAQNEDIVQWLLDNHPSARLLPVNDATRSISYSSKQMPDAARLDPIRSRTSALFIARITKQS
ncbi:SAM-dependent MTase RsmB/NOP-type domain-containing protein [Plasmodiophora brassicae]|uniref:SAM-dependent MTase RsmB/NOP-type domain-containing protein n=2 Tax=Plasmodiophora brassicae TaxID=37360 RepID=A0A3P3XZ53_PLABS|nr:unnamed protein product [Plasmodiophora brassicae]